tara:strand:- start:161 stop:283 length:123 start_codon:yes stop_codon:yes gene_type:complete
MPRKAPKNLAFRQRQIDIRKARTIARAVIGAGDVHDDRNI